MHVDVIYKGLKLNVVGTHIPATRGGLEDQPDPESFEIEQVYLNDCDVWDLIIAFNGEQELENLILDKL